MNPKVILMVDDDEDDLFLIKGAFADYGQKVDLRLASGGDEAMDYLHHRGKCALDSPRPSLILLDLHLPKRNGYEILREIRTSPDLKNIPVIVFSGSWEKTDVHRSYEAGANAFVIKAIKYEETVGTVKAICRFWLDIAVLPDVVEPARTVITRNITSDDSPASKSSP